MIQDVDLLKMLNDKPEKGLEMLMNNYIGLVYTIVVNSSYNFASKEDIEECVSDVIFDVYKNKLNLDLEKGSIKSYISVIAKRRAVDLLRKINKHNNIPLDDSIELQGETVNDEVKSDLISGIKELGEPDSEIIIRKYYFGQSTKEISKILKIKENTIDKKVSRGFDKLKKILGGVYDGR
ncbi:MAG: sigma-70 family RNA polymerase sigma factor [Oscillospiraceae bacterium]|nr:sigma-70 family RNA polymerase sigma factor [Oscillospiraceae bacterium]